MVRDVKLTLSSVEHARPPHHVPDLVGVSWVLSDDEALEVLLNEPASRGTTKSSGVADRSIRSSEFDKDGSEHSDTPRSTRRAVLVVLVHWTGDVTLYD